MVENRLLEIYQQDLNNNFLQHLFTLSKYLLSHKLFLQISTLADGPKQISPSPTGRGLLHFRSRIR